MGRTDYFAFFGLERRLTLDEAELERRFYALSRRLHPDARIKNGGSEQDALEQAAILNDAYRILRNPLSRAAHLIELEGVEAARAMPAEVVEAVFDWNAAAEENAEARVRTGQRLRQMLDESRAALEQVVRAYDAAPSRDKLAQVRALIDTHRYLSKVLNG